MRYQKTNLLAIDPGTREFGYAGFEDDELLEYGVKSLKRPLKFPQLLQEIDRVMHRLLSERRPELLVLEKNSFSQVRNNIRLAAAAARMRATAKEQGIPVIELDARTVRKAVTGDGNATKRETARVVAVRYPELKAYLKSSQNWRVRYYQNLMDAVACGRAYQLLHAADDPRVRSHDSDG